MLIPDVAPDPEVLKQFFYQPFCFSDSVRTGAGLGHLKSVATRVLRGPGDDSEQWREFTAANDRLAGMYEDFISAIVTSAGGSVEGMTYADVACNAGWFCYRMAQLGARATGLDAGNFADAFKYSNAALNTDARFVQKPYNFKLHQIEGFTEKFDIVTNIAFMCHSSDPTYLIEYLASIANKHLLIYSLFHQSDEYSIKFSKNTSRYFAQKYPICFDAATSVSTSLVRFALKECGFQRVEEVPSSPSWIFSPSQWRAFYASR